MGLWGFFVSTQHKNWCSFRLIRTLFVVCCLTHKQKNYFLVQMKKSFVFGSLMSKPKVTLWKGLGVNTHISWWISNLIRKKKAFSLLVLWTKALKFGIPSQMLPMGLLEDIQLVSTAFLSFSKTSTYCYQGLMIFKSSFGTLDRAHNYAL